MKMGLATHASNGRMDNVQVSGIFGSATFCEHSPLISFEDLLCIQS